MTKIIQAKYKRSRSLGVSLWGRAKDAFNKRNYGPGQHGPSGMKKTSEYGKQLNAKQRLKGYYGGITEKQFRRIFAEASRLKGDTGENLIGLLERRLDAIIYRLNIGETIFSAKQLVSHKHVKVNGKVVNIASYLVKENDVIEITEKAKSMAVVMASVQKMERSVPTYLEFDPKTMIAKFIRTPALNEVPFPIQMEPSRVVEYYSR